jgi:hypothetical protein
MPDIATINGIAEDNIATHNGGTASLYTSKNGDTWGHVTYVEVEYLVIAGGGGGGGGWNANGGGGGAGGYRTATLADVIATGAATTITVGAGGAGDTTVLKGSGYVVIKFPDSFNVSFSGGVTSSNVSNPSGYKVYAVTATSSTSETATFSEV